MIASYFKNADAKMTKAQYFEMCELLGTEPLDEEIPLELEDFPELVQTSFQIYYSLKDVWDTMSGSYLGKDMSNLFEFLTLFQVDQAEKLMVFGYLQQMDATRSRMLYDKQKAKESLKSKA